MTEMTDRVVLEKIVQALASYLKRDPASITESHHLRDDLGLDSVAVIELLFEIEERFKLQIPDQDLPGLSTVGSVAAYVKRRLDEPTSEPEKPTAAAAKKPASSKKSPATKKTSSPKPSATAKKPKKVAAAPVKKKKKVAAR